MRKILAAALIAAALYSPVWSQAKNENCCANKTQVSQSAEKPCCADKQAQKADKSCCAEQKSQANAECGDCGWFSAKTDCAKCNKTASR